MHLIQSWLLGLDSRWEMSLNKVTRAHDVWLSLILRESWLLFYAILRAMSEQKKPNSSLVTGLECKFTWESEVQVHGRGHVWKRRGSRILLGDRG